jgi:uncharacterized protein
VIDASTHGAPNWVDLSTPDVEAAMRFYRDLLGWTFERHETPMTPGGDYYIAKAGDAEVGGMMTAGPEQQDLPMWTVFFNVADVDETVGTIAQAGGAVLEPPFDIPDARIAVAADPTGGMFALSSGLQPSGAWLSNSPGAVCWIELLTRDPATAERFYAAVFGWKADTQDYEGTRYTMFTLDGELVAGGMLMPDEVPPEALAAFWSVYFAVPDCEAAEQRAAALGGTILRPTTEIGTGDKFAVVSDPTGATFQLMKTPPSRAAAAWHTR